MKEIKVEFSENIPDLLQNLQCTIAISCYHANRVIFISPVNHNNLSILSTYNINKPMGIAYKNHNLAIASENSIETFKDIQNTNNDRTERYMFYHRLTYHTGYLDTHDIYWLNNNLLFVNTRFSCLSSISSQYNFHCEWKPSFIKKITPFDHCHLNGLAINKNKPQYVTALGKDDTPNGWKSSIHDGGILINVEENDILLSNLAMPHSPRIYNNKLYMLLSATGEVVEVDTEMRALNKISKINMFVRGMDIIDDFLFIGISKQRRPKSFFKELPIAKETDICGIKIIHRSTAKNIGEIIFTQGVEELYDIRLLTLVESIDFIEKSNPDFIIQCNNNNLYTNQQSRK